MFEPPLRGRKGTSREAKRSIGFAALNPQVFDAIRWELLKRELGGPRASGLP